MSNKIVLVGMMGSGKSTIGSLLAKRLNYTFFDCDLTFENEQKIKITDYFEKFGEDNFRTIETRILNEAIKNDKIIISTGGGVVLREENRQILFNSDILTIYLKSNPSIIFDRIKNDKSRPLLLVENPKDKIDEILKSREKYYNLAKYTVQNDFKTTDEIVEEIIDIYGKITNNK